MRTVAGLMALISLLGGLSIDSAAAAGSVLYLRGHAVPSAPMTKSSPPPGSLPNFDPGRDDFPGLLVQKGSGSADESDPVKYQEWSHPVGGETLSLEEFVIWAAPKDFDENKTIIFNVHVLDCGGTCQVLDSASVTVSGAGWSQRTVAINVDNHTFAAGRKVTVKVVVDDGSDDDGWFAYGTATYAAHLALSSPPATTTTITTPTTTTTPAPTTTSSATTTSTSTGVSPVTPTTEPTAISTTAPQTEEGAPSTTTTTTALPARGGGADPGPPPSDPPTGGNDASSASSASSGAGFAPVVALPEQDDLGTVVQALGAPRTIEPEEGLMVAFSTTVEVIRMHWMSALALGTLAALLLLIGIRRDQEDELLATTAPLPHQLYGPGWLPRPHG